MATTLFRFGLLGLLLVSFAFSASVLLVMDVSGSMDDPLPTGERKIDAAKTAANNFISSSAGNEIGLMEFSYCSDTYDTPDPLSGDIRVVQSFTTDKAALQTAVGNLYPQGDTPIAGALQEAVAYFQQTGRSNGIIILLTDGEETCGGDAVAAARYANDNGYAVVNVIAYDTDAVDLEQAQLIAQAGGGRLYTADSQAELEQALQQASGSNVVCCLPTFIFLGLGMLYLRPRFPKREPEKIKGKQK